MSRLDLAKQLAQVKVVAEGLCRLAGCSSEVAPYFYESRHIPLENNFELALKIILIPPENIIRIIDKTFEDEVLRHDVYSYFSSRILPLSITLKKSNRFLSWLEKLFEEEIQALFESFSSDANLDKTKMAFKIFVQSLASEKIHNGFLHLCELIRLSANECSFDAVGYIDLYTPSVALHEVLLTLCPPFFENKVNSAPDAGLFIQKLKNIMNGLESLPFRVDGLAIEKFGDFQRDMCVCLHLLQKNMIVDGVRFNHAISYAEPRTFSLPVIPFQPNVCADQMIAWLTMHADDFDFLLTNQMIIVKLFEHTYRVHLTANEALATRISTNALAAVASVSSFVSSATARYFSVPVLRVTSTQCRVDSFLEKIKIAKTPDELKLAMRNLLLLRGVDIDSVHKQFIAGLIKQFLRELIAKSVVMQLQNNPFLSTQLVQLLNRPMVTVSQLEQCVDYFINVMRMPEAILVSPPQPIARAATYGSDDLVDEIDEVVVMLPAPGDQLTSGSPNSPSHGRVPTPSLCDNN